MVRVLAFRSPVVRIESQPVPGSILGPGRVRGATDRFLILYNFFVKTLGLGGLLI